MLDADSTTSSAPNGDDNDNNGDGDSDDGDDEENGPPEPIHDFFDGDYSPEELGYPNDRENSPDDTQDAAAAPEEESEEPGEEYTNGPDTSASESDSSDDGDLSPDELEEPGWEPPAALAEQQEGLADEEMEDEVEDNMNIPEQPQAVEDTARTRIERALRQKIHIEHFPSNVAGQPINAPNGTLPSSYAEYASRIPCAGDPTNIYSPFTSELDWKVARWAKLRGPGSTAVSELLEIPGVQDKLGLSYKNARELNRLVDALPAMHPRFVREEIVVADEAFDVYMRDVVECLKALFGDAEFARYLVFLPERHYADPDCTLRLYYDMHTGKWWWNVQKAVEAKTPGATIMPIIISSDKTQVTLFRNKTAYLVYLTIGNLPKDICERPSQRGQILIAYLPTTKLDHISNKAARRRTLANLFHACMKRVLAPLETLGRTGLPMTSGDGVTRHVHPIFAAYIGDYPEQLLVTGMKTGRCPVCSVPHDELRDLDVTYPCRSIHDIRKVLLMADDILHQVLQGVMKHVVAWIKTACNTAEIDARCRRFPPNHNVRLFLKGITPLSCLTGQEHADICRILLGLVVDMRLPNGLSSAPLVRAVRALLDFVYLAQYPIHSDESLRSLEDALCRFHENKHVFADLGVREDFNILKLHYCSKHYRHQIEDFGTADNFNTEYTERLHIDFAKEAYRATNKKNEYPQMTLWLERKEKVLRHDRYIQWVLDGRPSIDAMNPLHRHHTSHIKMTRNPSTKGAVSFDRLGTHYGATQFCECLARFVAKHKYPEAGTVELNYRASTQPILFNKVQVYHKAKFWESDFALYRHASDEYDIVHARPTQNNTPGCFDTALINNGTGGAVGIRVSLQAIVSGASVSFSGYQNVNYRVYSLRTSSALPLNILPTSSGSHSSGGPSQTTFPSLKSDAAFIFYLEWTGPSCKRTISQVVSESPIKKNMKKAKKAPDYSIVSMHAKNSTKRADKGAVRQSCSVVNNNHSGNDSDNPFVDSIWRPLSLKPIIKNAARPKQKGKKSQLTLDDDQD
ncbi:hypothetical protein NM688_g5449 [Phlebia brevispora]|uniref:Uncharacterized protein n=1 Tax=Phlebia brevispora TaxID=194682 RepID=A0ACC1SV57_9APHY|nr:hypothetical protein NM688_g5449 [Phlebia brevispora]